LKERRFQELLLNSRSSVDRTADCHFKWYNSIIRVKIFHELSGILIAARTSYVDPKEQFEHQEGIRQKLEPFSKADFSPYDDSFEITEVLRKMMEAFSIEDANGAIEILREGLLAPARACIAGNRLMPDERSCSDTVLDREKEKLGSLKDEVRQNINQLGQFIRENSESPESSPLVTWSIMAVTLLFYVGVICPLIILPLGTSESFQLSVFTHLELSHYKEMLLTSISVIFTIIMLVFLRINMTLKLSKEDLDVLNMYIGYSAYDHHLANYENNTT
jgi:hypothetical protein